MASRLSNRVINLARERWTLRASERDKLDRRRSTKLTVPPSSDSRPLQFIRGDRQALSTERYSRAGELATADACRSSDGDSLEASKIQFATPAQRNSTVFVASGLTVWIGHYLRWVPSDSPTIRYDTRCYFNVRSKADMRHDTTIKCHLHVSKRVSKCNL